MKLAGALSPLPNLRHLALCSRVAAEGSVSAAARALHLTQPAVTQAVQSVERELGGALFRREAGTLVATPEGARVGLRLERVLDLLRRALVEAAGGRGREPGDALHSCTAAQLLALEKVVRHHGFAQAARAGGVSRAGLNRHARTLEKATGIRLFEETSFGLMATREAEALAQAVGLARSELAQARAELQAAAPAVNGGRTVIGAMPLARSWLVPSAVLRFLAAAPGHTVEILDGPYDTLLEALRRGEADVLVGALRHPAPADVVQEHLFDDPLAIVLRAGHPLLGQRPSPERATGKSSKAATAPRAGTTTKVANAPSPAVTAAQLARYAWVAPRAGSPLRNHYNALFQAAGLPAPPGAVECNSWVAARTLLLASDRLMLLSARQVHQELEAGLLAVLPHPAGEVTRDIGLTLRRGWVPTAQQAGLLEELRAASRLG